MGHLAPPCRKGDKAMKNYEVDVYERYSHGKYGKEHYMGWRLSDTSAKNAAAFGYEILAGMTYREAFEGLAWDLASKRVYRDEEIEEAGSHRAAEEAYADWLVWNWSRVWDKTPADTIGIEDAYNHFTVKAAWDGTRD